MTPPQIHTYGDLSWTFVEVTETTVESGGHRFPAEFAVALSHAEWPVAALLCVAFDIDRGPVITGLRIWGNQKVGGKGVVDLQQLLGLVKSTVDEHTLLQEVTSDAAGWIAAVEVRSGGMAIRHQQVRGNALAAATPKRRRLLTREYLDQVAEAYREALSEGRPPTVAVAERFGVSHSNAAKYVRKARDVGALGKADGTRGGEVTER
jgi:hypothetical protein